MITKKTILIILITILFITVNAFSASVKERMKARIPEIDTLKASGIIGENNKGFLEFRVQSSKHAELISSENQDRVLAYNMIAEQVKNTTAKLVGERRALQIAEKAVQGTWLQDETGKWYQK